MRLVTFKRDGDGAATGVLLGNGPDAQVLDLHRADPAIPVDMLAFLAAGKAALDAAAAAVRSPRPGSTAPLSQVSLLAPVPVPGKLICIGRNYVEHAAEAGQPPPPLPIIFAKYANTVIGPGQPIRMPGVSEQIDYEGELGAIIGRRTKDVSEAEALSCVAGYTCFNDVSARDIQRQTPQWTLGKSLDTFGPLGPVLVTADEIPDPQTLRLRLSINGETMQDDNTGNMIFSVAYLVSYLSRYMTLEPGDLIATGTPSGVGYARKPPRWLRPGDVVRLEIQGIGALENPVAQ